MSNSERRYVDHPAPSMGLITLLIVSLLALLAVVPATLRTPSSLAGAPPSGAAWAVILLPAVILGFYFWPLYSTYYTVSGAGLEVRYGPWKRLYPWTDFATAYWQRGMFATRIGWPTVTPCVRLTDAVLLKRKAKGFGLYLTPNDSKAFLRRVAEFAPELTAESIL